MTRLGIGAALLIGGIATGALTIAPASHDFGKVAVMDFKADVIYTTTLPPGAAPGTSLRYTITGPDAADFVYTFEGSGPTVDPFDPNGPCTAGPQGVQCIGQVEFRPQSVGPKRATLEVTDNNGNRAVAAVRGEGVAALCLHTVVPCNYAHHYSGVVSWRGEEGHAIVDVVAGVASCNATVGGGAGMTSGPGLIGVEFGESADAPKKFYRITVACPTRYPPEPTRPAELGHDEFGSYKQPLPRGVDLGMIRAKLPQLTGFISEGADGVTWELCPNSQYRVAPRPGERKDQRRCTP